MMRMPLVSGSAHTYGCARQQAGRGRGSGGGPWRRLGGRGKARHQQLPARGKHMQSGRESGDESRWAACARSPEPSAGAGCSFTHTTPCLTAHWSAQAYRISGATDGFRQGRGGELRPASVCLAAAHPRPSPMRPASLTCDGAGARVCGIAALRHAGARAAALELPAVLRGSMGPAAAAGRQWVGIAAARVQQPATQASCAVLARISHGSCVSSAAAEGSASRKGTPAGLLE